MFRHYKNYYLRKSSWNIESIQVIMTYKFGLHICYNENYKKKQKSDLAQILKIFLVWIITILCSATWKCERGIASNHKSVKLWWISE